MGKSLCALYKLRTTRKSRFFKMDLERKQGVRGFELRESQRMMGGKAERWRGTDIGSCEHT